MISYFLSVQHLVAPNWHQLAFFLNRISFIRNVMALHMDQNDLHVALYDLMMKLVPCKFHYRSTRSRVMLSITSEPPSLGIRIKGSPTSAQSSTIGLLLDICIASSKPLLIHHEVLSHCSRIRRCYHCPYLHGHEQMRLYHLASYLHGPECRQCYPRPAYWLGASRWSDRFV
jgi:hypothetical protein